MDDLIIPAKDDEEGMSKLKTVLEVAAKNGLDIKWSKCQFLKKRIEYLGYEIENGFINPGERKIQAIKKFPVPQTEKQLQGFLGLTSYFRKFIHNYAVLAIFNDCRNRTSY